MTYFFKRREHRAGTAFAIFCFFWIFLAGFVSTAGLDGDCVTEIRSCPLAVCCKLMTFPLRTLAMASISADCQSRQGKNNASDSFQVVAS